MDILLKALFLYMFLAIAGLPPWAYGDIEHQPSLPANTTAHLQKNQSTKESDYVQNIYPAVFNNATVRTKIALNAEELNNRNTRNSDKQATGPIFNQSSYSLSILETSEVNSTILRVEAQEQNASRIEYSLWGPNSDYFHINQLNGEITLAKALEYNRINKYSLTAKATDPNGYNSTVPVHLDIKDVDTMNPHFIFPLYKASISENEIGNLSTQPEEVKAIDGDIGINEAVYYYISDVYPPEFRNAITINRSNGVISLNKEMDRETVSLLTVEMKAAQQNNLHKSADSVVLITILDENDNPPMFSQPIYKPHLTENSPPGATVLVLTASDKDEEGLSNGYFTTNNTMFKVDKMGAMYFTGGELDRELTPEITVKVWVFDAETNGLNSSALVIINIIDMNDNNPVFHNMPLFFTIPEGVHTSTSPLLVGQVNATDADKGLNGEVTITKASENGDSTFIVQQNGVIIVQGPLDRETKDRYVILLLASDSGTPPRKSVADLVIIIKDINDNAPTFTQHEYSAHLVLPKVKVGDPFLTVSATDRDTGHNSQISYRFAEPLSLFMIDEENGQISLAKNISTGTAGTSIALRVIATDHGVPALSSTTTVFITIEVGNTEFAHSNYSFSILEDMPEGTEVGSVQATAGPDMSIMYSILTYKEIFSITDNGIIITRTMLDREEQDSYSIIVTAVDSREPPNTAAVVVNISIIDVNDNMPVFSPLIHPNVTCQENMNFLDFGFISATDKDVGNNSAVTYSLENNFNGTFHINSSTGKLTTTKPLDAEIADSYDLRVVAKDSGIPPLLSSIMIHVSVQDVDDNPPIFITTLYNITVKENEPPHVILSISAVDKDIGNNAIISYSFTTVSHLFYIGEMSGNISNLEPLDFETSAQHEMTVIAYSPSDPQRQSTATVTVHVEDVNEEGPTVEYPVYHTVIWDGRYTPGSIILDINATKGNEAVDEGIHYSISGPNSEELFAIANATGHIFLTKDLPVHHSPLHYVLTVNCTDNGVPPQSTSVKVFVTISPSNISRPVFSADYYSPEPLDDWAVPHTYLTQIKAFYLPSSLVYSISNEDEDDFIMDPVTGIMRTKNTLNIDDFPSNITVKATDSQKPSIYSEAIVHVTVISGNQYAPVFPNPFVNVTVKEEQSIPTFIAQVRATDTDTGRNGDLTYSILNDQPFAINAKDGKIFATSIFDFETGPNEFQIFILAEDNGIPQKKQGYCTLVVHVLDINDCKPVFAPLDYITVEENVPVGTSIGQVTATDEDSGDNAFIVYSLFDEDEQFEIDELLGNIFIKNPLDYETKNSSLLTITATNNKTAPFYETSTELTIHLIDDNDNAPQFTQRQYFAELDMNSPVGTLVGVVNATDRDQGDNGVIDYFLLYNSSSENFLLENEREGRIITGSHLEPGEMNIRVFAKDRGSPPLNNSASVIVNVVKKDQSFPEFSPQEVSASLKNDRDRNEPVYTFSASNALGNNVTYRIVAGNDIGEFNLDEKTGELWTTNNFHYNMQPTYTITVEADRVPELKDPLPKNFARLEISEPDFHGRPYFEKEQYTASILNTVPPGSSVLKVTAKDQDVISNEALIYSLVNQTGEEFGIDKHTGQIIVGSLTGKAGIFSFTVQATDPYGVSDQTVVQIKVESPPSSDDVVEIKINQTLNEVQSHIPKIIRILEDVLQQNITLDNLDSDAKNKQDTDIQFQAVGTSKQELERSLTDKMLRIQKKLISEFGKPVDITILQPQKFVLSQEEIVGIVISILFCIVLVSAAFVLKSNISQSTSESAEKIDVENGNGEPACDAPAKDSKETDFPENRDSKDGNGGPASGASNKDNKQTDFPEKRDSEAGNGGLASGAQDKDKEISQKTSSESTEKLQSEDSSELPAHSAPEQDSKNKSAEEMTPGQQTENDVTQNDVTQDDVTQDDVTKPEELTDEKSSEAEPNGLQMDKTAPDKESVNGQQPRVIEEKQVEFVETWESYESEDGAGMDSTKKDEIPETTANDTIPEDLNQPQEVEQPQDIEQPQSKDDEKVTLSVTFLEDE